MKIICIGRNYHDHISELKNKITKEPLFFLKPDTALISKGRSFFIPNFSKEIHYELELIINDAPDVSHTKSLAGYSNTSTAPFSFAKIVFVMIWGPTDLIYRSTQRSID